MPPSSYRPWARVLDRVFSDGTFANNVNDARVYKNIDATLWGYEFNALRDLGNNYNIKFNVIFSFN